MNDDASPIRQAIDQLGSQAALAKAAGVTQPAINKALRTGRVAALTAIAIERATGGAVPRWRLRPDLWSQPVEAAPADAGVAA